MNQEELCPKFEKAVVLLSKRWTSLIIYQLLDGPMRFVALEHALLRLSGRVLSERLKELESEGILRRDVYPETPVRIEYKLTAKGQALAPVFTDIAKWANDWIELPDQKS